MDVKFGTSGLRGLSVDLNGIPSALYISAFCQFLKEQKIAIAGDKILVGRDFRSSSPDIAAICFGAIKASDFKPIDCSTLPTPALALCAMQQGAASIMITGSHIPEDRNGIKFYLPSGEITKNDELAITAKAEEIKGQVRVHKDEAESDDNAASDQFLSRTAALLPPASLSGMKVGVYQHSTVGRDMLVDCLEQFGADVTPLGRSDDFIPVDTEAVSEETISLLQGWAQDFGFDAIISADGDADRPLVADEQGNPMRGDLLGLIAANFLDAQVVVTPVTSNSGIEVNGEYDVIRTEVGSPFVITGMQQATDNGRTRVVGFEANGGFLTATSIAPSGKMLAPLPTRDCFLPILATLYAAHRDKQPLSSLAQSFALPVADADRVKNYAQERSAALMALLRNREGGLSTFLSPIGSVASVSDIDGLRVTLSDGRIMHFRPSGNAPEMRCYVEASTAEDARSLLNSGLALINGFNCEAPSVG